MLARALAHSLVARGTLHRSNPAVGYWNTYMSTQTTLDGWATEKEGVDSVEDFLFHGALFRPL